MHLSNLDTQTTIVWNLTGNGRTVRWSRLDWQVSFGSLPCGCAAAGLGVRTCATRTTISASGTFDQVGSASAARRRDQRRHMNTHWQKVLRWTWLWKTSPVLISSNTALQTKSLEWCQIDTRNSVVCVCVCACLLAIKDKSQAWAQTK